MHCWKIQPTNDGPGIIQVPAKKLDIPNVVTNEPTPNRLDNITDVNEFPGAVANPNINPSEANAANVWQYIIANEVIAATVFAIISTTMGLTKGKSETPPRRILAIVFAPPMMETI